MIKTAVIGASGYIGGHVLRKYREVYSDCVGTSFSKSSHGLVPFDLCHPDVDLLNLQETEHQAVLIASALPNIGWCESHPEESYALNVRGTLELVKQLDRLSLKTYFFSSDYVFDGRVGQYSDDAPTSPVTEYGRQKALVEREIPNITNNYAILRLSKIYGTTWKDNTLIDNMAAALLQGQKQLVATDQFFSPTHVNDVVSMLLHVQQNDVKGLINLCSAKAYSRALIGNMLVRALDLPSSLLEEIKLHSIKGMEQRPLDTSLKTSAILEKIQDSFVSVEQAVECVALNWDEHNRAKSKTA